MSAAVSPTPAERAVIWHDAECGGYLADLPLWRELAAQGDGPILDLGAGTGRVALDLASQGHDVMAVDSEAAFLGALRDRAEAAAVEIGTTESDIRNLRLSTRFALAIAPMQLLQLILTSGERRETLLRVRGALQRGGRAAFALVDDAPDAADNEVPLPDVREVDGWVYSSQPVWAGRDGDEIVVRRIRQFVSPAGDLNEEKDEVRLALLDADQAEAEAAGCGLRPVARHEIPETDDHVGSIVVELEAV
jgi:SAM-dependent methyltransferase